MPHAHHHDGLDLKVPAQTHRLLLVVVAPFALATALGLVLLWPSGAPDPLEGAFPSEEVRATVTEVRSVDCPDVPGQESFRCSRVEVEIEEGADAGDRVGFDYGAGGRARGIYEGDSVIVGKAPAGAELPNVQPYFFLDFDRRVPLGALAVLFALVVVALSRWRGLAALAGVGVSLLVLSKFVLPSILEGNQPLAVAVVGGAAIMFLALYLAHGFSASTTTAVLGTLASLFLTGALAFVFVDLALFTGAGSEEAAFLQISQEQVNLQGLLLASVIIGTLGVLDDVTVTQAAAVWELRKANPGWGLRPLYRSALRIGRDHIASAVNTLVLAYAGASLPLLILFSVSQRSLGQILNTEIVAEEIVRTLVGSIGLVASVPITTALAAVVVSKAGFPAPDGPASGDEPMPGDPPATPEGRAPDPERAGGDDRGFRIPRREREWREP